MMMVAVRQANPTTAYQVKNRWAIPVISATTRQKGIETIEKLVAIIEASRVVYNPF